MDKLTKEQRHKNMQAIRSRDTKIEILLRKALWHEGIRYRKNFKVCSCHPDIVITKYKIAVFCDGEFWHGKSMERYDVTTNVKYWHEKIRRNVERDLENTIELRDNGWIVLRFCFLRRTFLHARFCLRCNWSRSAIMAMNSELVGFPLAEFTV